MSQKRKDKRGRVLRNGETQDPKTGEYRFSYYENGKKRYSSIQNIRGVLRPAFRKAVQSEWIFKNPFDDFQLHEVIVNDSVRRDAVSPADERRFLEFVRNDKHFSRYYEGIYILFNTGMRISEFCGLTTDDLDMERRTISINKQLHRVGTRVYIEDTAKTKAGTRVIPMEDGVYEAFRTILEKRKMNPANPSVDGVSNFICLDKDDNPNRFRTLLRMSAAILIAARKQKRG